MRLFFGICSVLVFFNAFPDLTSGSAVRKSSGSTFYQLSDEVIAALLQKYRRALDSNLTVIQWNRVMAVNWPDNVLTCRKKDWALNTVKALRNSMDDIELYSIPGGDASGDGLLPAKEIYFKLLSRFQSESSLQIPGIPWRAFDIINLPPLSSFDFRNWTVEERRALTTNMSSIHFSPKHQDASLEVACSTSNAEVYNKLLEKCNQDTGLKGAVIPWHAVSYEGMSQGSIIENHELWTVDDRLEIVRNITTIRFSLLPLKKCSVDAKTSSDLKQGHQSKASFQGSLEPEDSFQSLASAQILGTPDIRFQSEPHSPQLKEESHSTKSSAKVYFAIEQEPFDILKSLAANVDSYKEFNDYKYHLRSSTELIPVPESIYNVALSRFEIRVGLFSKYFENWNHPQFIDLIREVYLRTKFAALHYGVSDCSLLVPNGYRIAKRDLSIEDLVFVRNSLNGYEIQKE